LSGAGVILIRSDKNELDRRLAVLVTLLVIVDQFRFRCYYAAEVSRIVSNDQVHPAMKSVLTVNFDKLARP
jgi:hypothetical protein